MHILLGQLAKAKVAGSNPVFRSNSKGPDAADFASAPGPSFFALRPGWHILGTWRNSTGCGSALSLGFGSNSSGARKASFPRGPRGADGGAPWGERVSGGGGWWWRGAAVG